VRTQEHPWRIDDDVADVDRFWYHARLHGVSGIRECHLPWRNLPMAVDAWVDFHPTVPGHDSGLLVP
jgi:hypothetical protein